MKVVCIKKDFFEITIGKVYEVDNNHAYESSIFFKIKDDVGYMFVPIAFFISLEEHRNRQLNKILI